MVKEKNTQVKQIYIEKNAFSKKSSVFFNKPIRELLF